MQSRAPAWRSCRIPAAADAAERILLDLCSLPTAPFVEHRVVEYMRQFVKKRRGLSLEQDRFGNLLISLSSAKGLRRAQSSRKPRDAVGVHCAYGPSRLYRGG